MSDLVADALDSALREVVMERVARDVFGRGLTPAERAWLRDGWLPASLMAEVSR